MPRWMRWIESVQPLDDPDLTDWTLAAQGFRFSWKARITQRVEAQQLHWESVGGLPTKGAVRFYSEADDRTVVQVERVLRIAAGIGTAHGTQHPRGHRDQGAPGES